MLLGILDSQAASQAIAKKYIRHSEKFNPNIVAFKNQGIPLKSSRLSNNEGNIVLSYDESLSDSIKVSLSAAKKLWESKLPTNQPIFISVLFEPLGNELSMVADVAYCETPNLEGCPCALASQISNFSYGSIDSPDGYIILNSDIDWNCRFSKESTSEYNLPTMVLRGIARCIGFGSSIIEDSKDQFFYLFGWPTYFDKLLYSEDKALSNMLEGGSEMATFVTSNKVKVHTSSQSYDIYAPSEFVQDLSLCYFDDKNSIMSYNIGQGNVDLSIDDKTSDVLRTIGWNLPQTGLSIQCNNISTNGIGSAYESHVFSLLKGNSNISNYKWKFLLKNKLGDFVQITASSSESFTIPAISSSDQFLVNINGDLEGRIECDYTLNGKKYSATPFALSLELKPTILSISDISITNNDQYEFSLNFNVRYAGADYVSVEIEEEYNTTLRNYRFDEPYLAHIKTGNITNLYYSWVTVIVSNKYGTVYETFEYEPTYGGYKAAPISNHASSDLIFNPHYIKGITLFTLDGRPIFYGTPSDFQNQTFDPGLYIKEDTYDNGYTKTTKILLR